MNKTADGPDYEQYAGYGEGNYHPGMDDPTQLPPQFYAPPYWDPYAWPKWALPTGLIATGLLGALGAHGIGKLLTRRAAAQAAAGAAGAASKLGHATSPPSHVIVGLGRIVRGG